MHHLCDVPLAQPRHTWLALSLVRRSLRTPVCLCLRDAPAAPRCCALRLHPPPTFPRSHLLRLPLLCNPAPPCVAVLRSAGYLRALLQLEEELYGRQTLKVGALAYGMGD